MASFVFTLVAFHTISLPSFIGGAMIAGLVKDRYLRRELAAAAEARAAIGSGKMTGLRGASHGP